jgi:hypothetical protein
MNQRHPLASPDSWVELRDPTELRAGDQMDIQDQVTADNGGAILRQMKNALAVALVVNWSLPLPIPTQDPQSLRLMSIPDYTALKRLVEPAEKLIWPADPEPEDPEVLEAAKADPASPTGDAAAS